MSWTINRQEQYYGQPEKDIVVWVYGLFTDTEGDYIKKAMRDCSGKEITQEWLYHIGVPEVYASRYDVRYLLNAASSLMDGEKPHIPLSPLAKLKLKKQMSGTDVEKLLKEFNII